MSETGVAPGYTKVESGGIMKKQNSLMKGVPSIVGNHPKKVVAIILVFTLFMGILASGMNIGMDEEAFDPDTPRVRNLNLIRDRFGTTGESVQIAFIAHDGDVFTTDVMMDMLELRIAFKEDPEISETLLSSDQLPDGMSMLVDTVLTVERVLEVDKVIREMPENTLPMVRSFENQSKMHEHMNSSLSSCVYLMSYENQDVVQNATQSFKSMSDIVSTPYYWMAVNVYEEEFMELMYVLSSDDSTLNKTIYVDGFLEQMEQEDPVSGLQEFLSFLEGVNGIMKTSPENSHISIGMFLEFMSIGETVMALEVDYDIMDSVPSLELTDDEKIDRIEEMDDNELKNTVKEAIEYDPENLQSAINNTISNFNTMERRVDESLRFLNNIDTTLESLEGISVDQSISKYRGAVQENESLLTSTIYEFQGTKSMLSGAENLPRYISGIANGIQMMVSEDFAPDLGDQGISAKSAIALVQLNSSMESDLRLKAQQNMIRLGDEVLSRSYTRVFAGQVMMEEINESTDESLNTLLPIAFVFVVVVLLLIYRAVAETLLSLLSLGFALVWTFGIGVLMGYQFNPIIIAVPVLITGLVIDYGIHMVMRYREEKEEGKRPNQASIIAISTVGGALFLTTLTTAIGFFSNTFSNISAMRQFGILAAVGILSSFVLMIAFLPAVLTLLDERREGKKKKLKGNIKAVEKQGKEIIGRILSGPAGAADKHPVLVIFVVALITVGALYGVINIDTTFNIQDFLPEDKPQSQNIQYITANFNVSTTYAYVLTEGELDNYSYLRALHDTKVNLHGDRYLLTVEGITSPLSVIREFGNAPFGAPNYNSTIVSAYRSSQPDELGIPTRNVTQLYDVLYHSSESRESIRRVLFKDEEGSYSLGVLMVKENSQLITQDMKNAARMEENMIEAAVPLEAYSPRVTSSSIIGHETTEELSATQIRSLFATIIIVGVLLTIVFYYIHNSLVLGVITTIPVAVITLWIVGTMYVMDVPLNVMTVSITALTVGMGVDYSIHVTHRFTEELTKLSPYEAMHETIQNTGAALVGSAATTIGAFAILTYSDILPLSQFGLITAMAIGYSFLVSIFVLPSALMIWERRR